MTRERSVADEQYGILWSKIMSLIHEIGGGKLIFEELMYRLQYWFIEGNFEDHPLRGNVITEDEMLFSAEEYGKFWLKIVEVARRVKEGTLPYYETIHRIERLLIEGFPEDPGRIVKVDYDKDVYGLLEEYDKWNYDGSELDCPIPIEKSEKTGKKYVLFVLMPISKEMKSDEVNSLIMFNGLRSANVIEGVHFAQKYPKVVVEMCEKEEYKSRMGMLGSLVHVEKGWYCYHEISVSKKGYKSIKLVRYEMKWTDKDTILCVRP